MPPDQLQLWHFHTAPPSSSIVTERHGSFFFLRVCEHLGQVVLWSPPRQLLRDIPCSCNFSIGHPASVFRFVVIACAASTVSHLRWLSHVVAWGMYLLSLPCWVCLNRQVFRKRSCSPISRSVARFHASKAFRLEPSFLGYAFHHSSNALG